ncbi:MAG: DUF262 domain-containing protein [Bacilli bacterium]|nr:DUF262 domain-containing protein [Bacilli bacterium]
MLINNKDVDNDYINLYSLSDKKIGIPIFQRFYAWKENHIKTLLEDITNAINSDKELYLLDFIYYKENGKIMLADGQQRIVTINLLIKAINEKIEVLNESVDQIKPFDISYDIKENDDSYNESYHNYIKSPFKNVYTCISNFIDVNVDNLQKIREIITKRIFIYFKKCSNADDAFSIFTQINTGGKPLTKEEIIKTALDQYSKIYDVKINTLNIKDLRQDVVSYYKIVEDNYSINFDQMTIMTFFKEYVTKDKESFIKFKEAINSLDKIKNNPLRYIIKYINRPILFDVMNVLTMKGIDLKLNRKYVEKVMLPLCFASITMSFKLSNPSLINHLTTDLIKKIKKDESVNDLELYIAEFIDDNSAGFKMTNEEFSKALGEHNNGYRNIKKALMIMDVIYRNTAGELNVESINLEHIYPQKPDTEWATKGWPTSHDEQIELIDNIGNYLLLNEAINKRVQNKYITYKVPEYNNIIPKDLMLQTEINTVNFDDFETKKEEYIYERQVEIAKKIRTGLPFGQKLIVSQRV